MQNQNNPDIGDNDIVVVDTLDTDSFKKNLETTLAQKKHWREKAQSYEAKVKDLEAKLNEKPQISNQDSKPETPKPAGLDQDSLLDNLEVFKTLESDEIATLRSEAKSIGSDVVKYVKSLGGQALLKELRATKKSQAQTPTPSNKVPQFNGKPVDAVLTDEKSSPADKQQAFEKLKAARLGTNSSI